MPKSIHVKSLYKACLENVHHNLTELTINKVNYSNKELETWIKTMLPRNMKEELIKYENNASFTRNKAYNFNYMKLIIDSTFKNIILDNCLLDKAMTSLHYIQFMQYLYEERIYNLYCLCLCFKKYIIETSKLKEGNYYLCLTLNNGLARNLRKIVLPFVADNSVLKALGQHCEHLIYLDISNSWHIDEDGIFNLLFKNPEDLNLPVDVMSSDMDPISGSLLDGLLLPDEELNQCCFTIQEFRLQDTNTSATNVFIILLSIKNLKSLGGYLYFRSVGDAIATLKSHIPDLKLNLTKLWDAHLTPKKLEILAQVLPDLTTLTTRVENVIDRSLIDSYHADTLPYELNNLDINKTFVWPFHNITHLTLDFDFFIYDELFHSFLIENGRNLIKLVLVDQPFGFNLSWIAENCPKLTELKGRVVVIEDTTTLIELPCLIKASLTVTTMNTLVSIFLMFPCIKTLTIEINDCSPTLDRFYSGFTDEIVALQSVDPPCFESLEDLRIHVLIPNNYVGFTLPDIMKLLEVFKNLNTFGNSETWANINVQDLRNAVKEKCWDVDIKNTFDDVPDSAVYYQR